MQISENEKLIASLKDSISKTAADIAEVWLPALPSGFTEYLSFVQEQIFHVLDNSSYVMSCGNWVNHFVLGN